jgi:hypothetical protein
MHQPQPSVQGYQRRDEEQRDAGLPAFITGGAPQPQGGSESEQGDRGDRFGRRRRRFRPRGPNDMEQRGEGAADAAAPPSGDAAKPGE